MPGKPYDLDADAVALQMQSQTTYPLGQGRTLTLLLAGMTRCAPSRPSRDPNFTKIHGTTSIFTTAADAAGTLTVN
jgi:hypothetical protein